MIWSFRVLLAPGCVLWGPRRSEEFRGSLWRSLEVRGSPELQNGGLRALEEAWDDFLLEAFWSFSVLLGRVHPGRFPGHLALLDRVLVVLASPPGPLTDKSAASPDRRMDFLFSQRFFGIFWVCVCFFHTKD